MCSAAGALQIQHFTFSSAGFFILLVFCVNIFLVTLRCCCKDKIFCSECLLWNHCVSEYSAQRTHVTAQFYQTRNSAFEIKSYIFIIIDECDTCKLAINPVNHEYDIDTKSSTKRWQYSIDIMNLKMYLNMNIKLVLDEFLFV